MSRALAIIVRHGALVVRPDGEVVSLRRSSVSELGDRKLLNATQVEAAFRFRNAWLALEPMQRAASPFERQRGQPTLAEAERIAGAKKKMRQCKALLGVRGFDLVSRICGDGYHIRDLQCRSRRERDTMTDMLRMHLSDMAAIFDSND